MVRASELSGSRPLWFGYQTGSSWDGFAVFGACNSFSWMCLDFGSGSNIYSAFQSQDSTLWIGGHTNSADGDYSTINLANTSTATTVTIGNTTGVTAIKVNTGTGNFNVNSGQLYLDKSSGSIGIGTSSPAQKLDIAGGNGRVQSGYNWLTNSDIKFKTNITPLIDVLGKVSHLRGVRYDLKNDNSIIPGQGKQIGFIAQELEEQYPELVFTESNGTKSVAYDKMTAILVEAVKQQQKEIEDLKSAILELKEKR